jgi:tRNA G26 N,N-dimethylase Trm1
MSQKAPTAMSLNSQNEVVSMKRINALFLQFAAFYGPIWRSQLKEDAFVLFMKKEWHNALAHFSDRTVELAINVCKMSKELPPTLPQFVEICKNIHHRNTFTKTVPYSRQEISEVGKSNLSQIKEILNGARPVLRRKQ